MDEQHERPEHYEDTVDPRYPPASVTNRGVRRAAVRAFVGPIAVLFAVLFLGYLYWSTGDRPAPGAAAVGTSGQTDDHRPASTADELQDRGVASQPGQGRLTDRPTLTLRDTRVIRTGDGGRFWVQLDGEPVEILPPDGSPVVQVGGRVDIDGAIEGGAGEPLRLRAHRVVNR